MNPPTSPAPTELSLLAELINGSAIPDSPAQQTFFSHTQDPQHTLEALDYHGIAMLVQQNAEQRQHKLPTPIGSALSQRRTMMVANEMLKQAALTTLFQAFEAAGLQRIVLFKGSALAYGIYANPWLRPRSDSDCIIDRTDLPRYSKVFAELGYQQLFAIEGKHIHYQTTFSKPLAGQAALNVDVHWHINNRKSLARAFNVDQLLRDGEILSGLSGSIRIPCAVDSLLIASLHRLGHHVREERLIWLYDIHLLAGKLSDSNWQQLCSKAQDKKLAAVTLDALQNCATLLHTQVPTPVLQSLRESAQQNEPSSIFLQRDLPEWKYFWLDLRALPGILPKLQTIWQNLLPPPDYIRRQMGTRSALLGYGRRLIRGVKRIRSR